MANYAFALIRRDGAWQIIESAERKRTDAARLVIQHRPTCAIVITAYADEETRARAEAVGAMGFLSKPVQAAGVLEEVPRAQARFAELEATRTESRHLDDALHTRALVEAAKRVLIESGSSPASPPSTTVGLVHMPRFGALGLRRPPTPVAPGCRRLACDRGRDPDAGERGAGEEVRAGRFVKQQRRAQEAQHRTGGERGRADRGGDRPHGLGEQHVPKTQAEEAGQDQRREHD